VYQLAVVWEGVHRPWLPPYFPQRGIAGLEVRIEDMSQTNNAKIGMESLDYPVNRDPFGGKAANPVVEVEGSVHDFQAAYDANRFTVIEAYVYRVVRIKNEEVKHNINQVLEKIRQSARIPPWGT